jgi:hypothetical protein
MGTTKTGEIIWLPISQLRFDPRVNRPIDQAKVNEIKAEFDPDAFGVVEVSERKDGTYCVLDAQHRVQAVLEMGWIDQTVPCRVHKGLDVKREAALFLLLNNSRAPKPLVKFQKRIVAGEPIATAIAGILEKHHLVLDGQPTDGHIAAVAALESVYTGKRFAADQVQPKVLDLTLGIATEAWGTTRHAVQAHVISGLGSVIHQYGSLIERETMVAKLAAYQGGPSRLIGAARGLRELRPWSVADCVSSIIVDTYNRQRRTGKLAEWKRS